MLQEQDFKIINQSHIKLGNIDNQIRYYYDSQNWSHLVKLRDDFTCQICGRKSFLNFSKHRLEAHHIKPRSTNPHLRCDITNGISLCSGCHSNIHRHTKSAEAFLKNQICECGHKKNHHKKLLDSCKWGRICPCKEFQLEYAYDKRIGNGIIPADVYFEFINFVNYLMSEAHLENHHSLIKSTDNEQLELDYMNGKIPFYSLGGSKNALN